MAVYRSLIFLPVIFSLLVTALVWRVSYAPEGLFNNALQAAGLNSWSRIWLAEPRTVLYALVVASLWQSSGYIMVLYLAGSPMMEFSWVRSVRLRFPMASRISDEAVEFHRPPEDGPKAYYSASMSGRLGALGLG